MLKQIYAIWPKEAQEIIYKHLEADKDQWLLAWVEELHGYCERNYI